jgi:hypothetical protein
MTYHDNNSPQPASDPYVRRPMADGRGGMGWAIPVVIVAILAIGGMMLYSSSDNTTTTASNNAPVTRLTTPVAPATPAPTPPAKTQ